MKLDSVSAYMLGARFERARLSTRDFKNLESPNASNELAHSYSSATRQTWTRTDRKGHPFASPFATWAPLAVFGGEAE